jgi:hypothetical protein
MNPQMTNFVSLWKVESAAKLLQAETLNLLAAKGGGRDQADYQADDKY